MEFSGRRGRGLFAGVHLDGGARREEDLDRDEAEAVAVTVARQRERRF